MTKQSWNDPAKYTIKVKGCLGKQWSSWFEDFTITSKNGITSIKGNVVDQAKLHGIILRIRDLSLPLISIDRVDTNNKQSKKQS
jgi:hypothetical protein